MHRYFSVGTVVAIAAAVAFCLPSVVYADVRLPGFFNDHMVVQQNADVIVWGLSLIHI